MTEQFLTFKIGDARYAVSVFRVLEVLPYSKPQPLPCPDPLIAGIIRSRDRNVAIVRLREKFGLDRKEADNDTHIVVFEIGDNGTKTLFGGIVDSVLEVISLDLNEREPPPPMGNTIASRFVSGVGMKNGEYIIILNADTIFTCDELETICDAVITKQEEENETAFQQH